MANKKQAQEFYGDPDHIAQGILTCDFIFDPGGKGLEGGAYTLRSWQDDFYHWQDGCYVRLSDAEMKRIVTEHIQGLNDKMQDDEQQISIGTQRISNILLCLKGRIGIPENIELNTWKDGREKLYNTVAVKNGLLLIRRNGSESPKLIDHTPDYFNVTKLPYAYEPAAKCDLWPTFLDDVMLKRQEYVLLLQQWLGYILRPDLRLQKFLLCVGEGANGKGVFFEVVQALVGVENCSQIPIARFDNPFALVGTLGKMVNLTHEAHGLIAEQAETTLKSFTSGDRMTFERKYRDAVSEVPTAKIMIATNDLPRFNDRSQAIWRRILLVPFDKVVAENMQIDTLADELKKELPGILNWGLEGLRKLNAAGRFTVPDNSKTILEDYRQDSNPARAFLSENYTTTNNGEYIGCETLYQEYAAWCKSRNYRPLADRTFGKEVKRVFPDIKHKRPGSGNARLRVYDGIASVTSNTSNDTFI